MSRQSRLSGYVLVACTLLSAPVAAATSDDSCGTTFTLRLDFSNTAVFGCPTSDSLIESSGALFSVSHSELSNTTSASADGIAAVVFRLHTGTDGSFFQGLRFGPYIQSDSTYQLPTATSPHKDTYSLVEGGFVQATFNPFGGDELDYVRARGGITEVSNGSSSSTFVAEYLPTNQIFGSTRQIPGTFLTFVFYPELELQYDHAIVQANPSELFLTSDNALRLGPQIALTMYDKTSPFLHNFSLNATYHYSSDLDSGRNYSWVQTVLSYQLNKAIGLSVSYGAGNSESTANETSTIKFGASLKF